MKLTVPYIYEAKVKMPGKRKETSYIIEDKLTVEIKEYSQNDFPVALIIHSGENKTLLHYANKRLFKKQLDNGEPVAIDLVKENTENKGENYIYSKSSEAAPFFDNYTNPLSTDPCWKISSAYVSKDEKRYTKEEIMKSCREWVSDNKAAQIKAIRDTAKKLVVFEGNMYEVAKEPFYQTVCFGLGNNHASTALMVSTVLNSSHYYNALEYERALEESIETANRRGDTNSIESIKSKYSYIEVLIPEAVKMKPMKK